MGSIRTFNSAVSLAISREDETYRALFGTVDFIPEATIDESSDFNCGALCNELEFLRTVSDYYIQSFDTDVAEDENLDALIQGFINLPRRNQGEADSIYRNRFRSLVVQKVYPRRTNRWAIIEALSYFIPDTDTIQIIENFDEANNYFQVRIEGTIDTENSLFLDHPEQGYLDQYYVGGAGIGPIITYLGDIIDRIRAAGVESDIVFVSQDRFTKDVAATIGSVQLYQSIDAQVLVIAQLSKTINATVV